MSDPLFPGTRGTSVQPRTMGLFGRIVAALLGVAALVVGFMVSAVVFAVALVVGLVAFGWLWWKMRRAIRLARQDPRFSEFQARSGGMAPPRGDVIEGEVLRREWKDGQSGPE